ncbi:MAG: hypothetical protein JW869_00410 [Candidatus Omnitrophica bacterium]|nr:hypothetical protein [Candidatus Omnitrophota bacterium]
MIRNVLSLLLATLIIFALGLRMGICQDAGANGNVAKILHKLDQILANQEEIFRQFEVVQEELEIIKVRATRR